MKYSVKQNCYQLWDGSLVQCKTTHAVIQSDQKVSVHLIITVQSSGVQRLFDHPVLATLQRSLNTLQKASASNLAFLNKDGNVCRVSTSVCIEVSGHTFEHLVTIGNKMQRYLRILQWFCIISNLRQSHFDDPWPCKDACPTNCCLTINLGFGPCYLLMKTGNGVLPHTVQLTLVP